MRYVGSSAGAYQVGSDPSSQFSVYLRDIATVDKYGSWWFDLEPYNGLQQTTHSKVQDHNALVKKLDAACRR